MNLEYWVDLSFHVDASIGFEIMNDISFLASKFEIDPFFLHRIFLEISIDRNTELGGDIEVRIETDSENGEIQIIATYTHEDQVRETIYKLREKIKEIGVN